MNELINYLQVDLVENKPRTRVISLEKFLQLRSESDNTVIRSEASWRNLRQRYEDIAIEGNAVVFPELNTLFSYLLPLLVDVDGNGQSISNSIVITANLERKKI